MAKENLTADFQQASKLCVLIDTFLAADEPDKCWSDIENLQSLVAGMPVSQVFDLIAHTRSISSECAASIVFKKDLDCATADNATPAARARGREILQTLAERFDAPDGLSPYLIPEDPAEREALVRKVFAEPVRAETAPPTPAPANTTGKKGSPTP